MIKMMWSGYFQALTMVTACTLVASVSYSQDPFSQNDQGLAQQGKPAQPVVVATVNGDPITKPEFDQAAQQRVARAQQSAAQAGEQLSPQEIAELKSTTLDLLIESRLVEEYAIENVDVPKDQVKETIVQVEQQLAQQKLPLEAYLNNQGQTMNSFTKRIKGSLAWQGLQKQAMQPDKLQQFYQSNQQMFQGKSFEEVQPQVAQAYAGSLWEQIVNDRKPKARIEKQNANRGAAAGNGFPRQPSPTDFPPPGNGQ